MTNQHRIPEETSVFLDAVRVVAALVVFLSHFGAQLFSGGLLWFMYPLGARAVDVFFVLSGFLISHAAATSERDLRRYTVARLARIYSVAIPAICVTLASYWWVSHLGESANYFVGHTKLSIPAEIAINLGFLGNIWNLNAELISNGPYWSLGFEVPYYILFGLTLLHARWKYVAIATLALLFGPKIMLMMVPWLMGAGLRRVALSDAVSPRAGAALCIAAMAGFAVWWFSMPIFHGGAYEPLTFTLKRLQILGDSYMMASLFAIFTLGVHAMRHWLSAPLRLIARPVRWLAGMSFAFYLLHIPLMDAIRATSPWPVTAWQTRSMYLIVVPLAVWALSYVSERRKGNWARLFNRALPGSPTRRTAPSL